MKFRKNSRKIPARAPEATIRVISEETLRIPGQIPVRSLGRTLGVIPGKPFKNLVRTTTRNFGNNYDENSGKPSERNHRKNFMRNTINIACRNPRWKKSTGKVQNKF